MPTPPQIATERDTIEAQTAESRELEGRATSYRYELQQVGERRRWLDTESVTQQPRLP